MTPIVVAVVTKSLSPASGALSSAMSGSAVVEGVGDLPFPTLTSALNFDTLTAPFARWSGPGRLPTGIRLVRHRNISKANRGDSKQRTACNVYVIIQLLAWRGMRMRLPRLRSAGLPARAHHARATAQLAPEFDRTFGERDYQFPSCDAGLGVSLRRFKRSRDQPEPGHPLSAKTRSEPVLFGRIAQP
jgi:hypothetical protein